MPLQLLAIAEAMPLIGEPPYIGGSFDVFLLKPLLLQIS